MLLYISSWATVLLFKLCMKEYQSHFHSKVRITTIFPHLSLALNEINIFIRVHKHIPGAELSDIRHQALHSWSWTCLKKTSCSWKSDYSGALHFRVQPMGNILIYIYTHLIAEFYNITGVCSTVTVNAQLQTDQCEQAGIPPLVQGYSKLHLSMRITSCLRQTWPSVEVCSLLLHCISHSIWICLFCPDMLDYLLERPDPAVQNVEDLLNIYENPYKVVPTAGEFQNSRNTHLYCPIPTERINIKVFISRNIS